MKFVSSSLVLALLLAAGVSCRQQQADPTEAKINSLLSQMTLEEKIGQMNQINGQGLDDDIRGQIRAGQIGSLINQSDVEVINELQRVAVEESRLGIPIIFGRDVIHGFKTMFPIPLGQAATWNPDIVRQGARIAAQEASSDGIRWTFTPMIDVSRDPRWGRIAESCGEDPYLTSVMGVAMVEGFQGDALSDPTSIAACAKHFAAYGASEAGKDYNTTWIPDVLLYDVYLPPFEAVAKAGCATFMCSFNDINGVPSSGNARLNKTILRDEWQYDGVLVSDFGSIDQMIVHGFCLDNRDAARVAVNAGVDMDMMSRVYLPELAKLVQDGLVSRKTIDTAVRNILRLKFRLGLFDNPYTEVKADRFYAPASLEKARQAAVESAVLLKNNDVLPLWDSKTVAVVGPLADAPAEQIGTWCFDAEPEHSITPLAAIRESFGDKVRIISEPGLTYSRDNNPAGIRKAVAAARRADVVLYFAGEEAILSGEARCRADISLPGAQRELLKALKATGKPVVLIVMAGRPLTITEELDYADAVLYAFHGGTMAGPALIDLIFGNAVPSGKLPVTIPRMVGQVPIYYAHKNTGRPASGITLIDEIPVGAGQFSFGATSYHLDAGDKPLFPFGFGLSYSTFDYSELTLSSDELSANGVLSVSCQVTNTGRYDALETVQLYIRDVVASLAQPVRRLKGFEKISLKAGETKTVSFDITPDMLSFRSAQATNLVEPGEFHVWIAPDSQSGKQGTFVFKMKK
jgi:beta-glucosidase